MSSLMCSLQALMTSVILIFLILSGCTCITHDDAFQAWTRVSVCVPRFVEKSMLIVCERVWRQKCNNRHHY